MTDERTELELDRLRTACHLALRALDPDEGLRDLAGQAEPNGRDPVCCKQRVDARRSLRLAIGGSAAQREPLPASLVTLLEQVEDELRLWQEELDEIAAAVYTDEEREAKAAHLHRVDTITDLLGSWINSTVFT